MVIEKLCLLTIWINCLIWHFNLELFFVGHFDYLVLQRLYFGRHVLVSGLYLFLEWRNLFVFCVWNLLELLSVADLHSFKPLVLFCELLLELLLLLAQLLLALLGWTLWFQIVLIETCFMISFQFCNLILQALRLVFFLGEGIPKFV